MTTITNNKNNSIGTKLGHSEYEEIINLVNAGMYVSNSDFVRQAIRDKLKAIKVVKIRDIDYDMAKKEVLGYYKQYGEAYISELANDLELDLELVNKIVEDLEKENRIKDIG